MSKDTRSLGLAFLTSLLLVAGVAAALDFTFADRAAESVCHRSYSLACIF